MNNTKNFLNGIQINPLSFVDEGVENCIDNLKNHLLSNEITDQENLDLIYDKSLNYYNTY